MVDNENNRLITTFDVLSLILIDSPHLPAEVSIKRPAERTGIFSLRG